MAKRSLNLNALKAQQAEAQDERELEIVLGDPEETFYVPFSKYWPVSVVRKAMTGGTNDMDLFAELMGQATFDRLCELGMNMSDFTSILEEVNNDTPKDVRPEGSETSVSAEDAELGNPSGS